MSEKDRDSHRGWRASLDGVGYRETVGASALLAVGLTTAVTAVEMKHRLHLKHQVEAYTDPAILLQSEVGGSGHGVLRRIVAATIVLGEANERDLKAKAHSHYDLPGSVKHALGLLAGDRLGDKVFEFGEKDGAIMYRLKPTFYKAIYEDPAASSYLLEQVRVFDPSHPLTNLLATTDPNPE